MKVVIIGDTGFIGKNIYQNLESSGGYELIGISDKVIDLSNDKSDYVLSKYFSHDCIVIMCAGVKKQLGDTLETFEQNLAIINNFCKAASLIPPKRIIFFSSASVYGEDVAYPEKITERTPVQPRTYYGIAKYAAERLLEKVCGDNNIKLVLLRPPLVYGKDDLSRGYGPTGFIYKAINNDEIILWGDGSELREFIYVDDIGRIVNRIIEHDISGIVNLVSGNSYSFKQIIDSLNKITNTNLKILSRQRTNEKVDHRYSNKLINQMLGNFEFTCLRDGLRQTYCSIINELKAYR